MNIKKWKLRINKTWTPEIEFEKSFVFKKNAEKTMERMRKECNYSKEKVFSILQIIKK